MNPLTFMLIAGEPSGDVLAADLVGALRDESARFNTEPAPDLQPLRGPFSPRFFGAGGARMAGAGVELAFDMTEHAVIGLWEVLKHYGQFRRLFEQLLELALDRQPDAVVCVDFSGFNRRFARVLRQRIRSRRGRFNNWAPKIIQYVSPQVWASRPGRAQSMAKDFDLLLSIFPFEKEWYAQRVPQFRVEFVGHPMLERFASPQFKVHGSRSEAPAAPVGAALPASSPPLVLLLPGSRPGELRNHLPVLVEAVQQVQAARALRLRMVLPNETLAAPARSLAAALPSLEIQAGGLPESLAQADLALASTGTVTLECAYFGVPTVALYKSSWMTWQIARRIVRVKHVAMPNLLAGEAVYPELIQDAATPANLAREALALLNNPARRAEIRAKLARVVTSLGAPGANQRAARAILGQLLQPAHDRCWATSPTDP